MSICKRCGSDDVKIVGKGQIQSGRTIGVCLACGDNFIIEAPGLFDALPKDAQRAALLALAERLERPMAGLSNFDAAKEIRRIAG